MSSTNKSKPRAQKGRRRTRQDQDDDFRDAANIMNSGFYSQLDGDGGQTNSATDDPDKIINFKKLLEQHISITERNIKYTIQQVEDAIFVGKDQSGGQRIISLQYIFYQKEGNYKQLQASQYVSSPIVPHKAPDNEENIETGAFKSKPVLFTITDQKEFEDQLRKKSIKAHGGKHGLQDCLYIEPILVMYTITKDRKIITEKQTSIKYNTPYHPSQGNKMRLKLSLNKQWVYLVCQEMDHKSYNPLGRQSKDSSDSETSGSISEPDEPDDSESDNQHHLRKTCQISIQAWDVSNLKEQKFKTGLIKALKCCEFGKYVNLVVLGTKNQYYLLVLKKHGHAVGVMRKPKYLEYLLFDAAGQELLKINNGPAWVKQLGTPMNTLDKINDLSSPEGSPTKNYFNFSAEPASKDRSQARHSLMNQQKRETQRNLDQSNDLQTRKQKRDANRRGSTGVYTGDLIQTKPTLSTKKNPKDKELSILGVLVWHHEAETADSCAGPDDLYNVISDKHISTDSEEDCSEINVQVFYVYSFPDEKSTSYKCFNKLFKIETNSYLDQSSQVKDNMLFVQRTTKGGRHTKDSSAKDKALQKQLLEAGLRMYQELEVWEQKYKERERERSQGTGPDELLCPEEGWWPTGEPSEMFPALTLPSNWFIKEQLVGQAVMTEPKAWRANISVNTTCCHTKLAFINKLNCQYLAVNTNRDPRGAAGAKGSQLERGNAKEVRFNYTQHFQASHARNQMTKSHLFFIQDLQAGQGQVTVVTREHETKTFSFKQEHANCSVDVAQLTGEEDCDGHQPVSSFKEVLLMNITKDDQNIKIAKHDFGSSTLAKYSDRVEFERETRIQEIQAKFPILAYNIGMNRLVIQNTLGKGTSFIYWISEKQEEKFFGFVEYIDLNQMGFDPSQFHIEASSQIVFLTQDIRSGRVFINIMFVDPYYEQCQIVLFKSTKFFFPGQQNETLSDLHVQKIIFTSAKMQMDTRCEIMLLSQFYDSFYITELIDKNHETFSNYENSNLLTEKSQHHQHHEVDVNHYQKQRKVQDGLRIQHQIESNVSPTKIKLDQKGNIYYILQKEGQCIIYMVRPTQSKIRDHVRIYEMKSDVCLGFDISDDSQFFYFVDENKQVHKLSMMTDCLKLQLEGIFYLKDKDLEDFKVKPSSKPLIIRDVFLVHKCSIFYLYNDKKLPNGILDSDKLQCFDGVLDVEGNTDNLFQFHGGPFQVHGSNEFLVIYLNRKTMKSFARFFMHPDSNDKSLIADYENKCDLATYLDNGDILLKIHNRYLVFDQDGGFIGRVKFYEIEQQTISATFDQDDNDLQGLEAPGNRNSKAKTGTRPSRRTARARKPEAQPAGTERAGKSPDNAIGATAPTPEKRKEHIDLDEPEYLTTYEDIDSDDEAPVDEEVTEHDRMHLLKVSRRNKCYLFADRLDQVFVVYKLVRYCDSCMIKQKRVCKCSAKRQRYFFVEMYKIDILELKTTKRFYCSSSPEVNFSQVAQHIIKCGKVKINDEGHIDISFNSYSAATTKGSEQQGARSNEFDVYISIIKHLPNSSKNENQFVEVYFKQRLAVNSDELEDFTTEIEKRIRDQSEWYNQEYLKQFSQTQKSPDDRMLRFYSDNVLKLKTQLQHIVWQEIINNEILIICYSKYIKYTKLDFGVLRKHRAKAPPLTFETMDMEFSPNIEILKIQGTAVQHHFQVVAKEIKHSMIIVLTWDIQTNVEVSMFQLKCRHDCFLQHFVVRGINLNSNYFVSEQFVYDLETNIPIQSTSKNEYQSHARKQPASYGNQRKIFRDSSRYLSVVRQNVLSFATNRRELVLWKDICRCQIDDQVIEKDTSLEMFNKILKDQSLFHFFSGDSEIIAAIHMKYVDSLKVKNQEHNLKQLPLVILKRDNQGKNALELARANQRPKAFELMVDCLSTLNNFFYTKNIIDEFKTLVSYDCDIGFKFLDSLHIIPITVYEGLTLPWRSDMQELIFPCHTSLVTRKIILEEAEVDEELHKQQIADREEKAQEAQKKTKKEVAGFGRNKSPESQSTSRNQSDAQTRLQPGSVQSPKNQNVPTARYLGPKQKRVYEFVNANEHEDFDDDDNYINQRLNVCVINLEWVFEGNNCEQLVSLLVNRVKKQNLKSRSIRSFILLLWKIYQPRIVERVFYWYCLYLLVQMILSSGFATTYFSILTESDERQLMHQGEKMVIGTLINALTILALLLWCYFFSIEMRKLFKNPRLYLMDLSNWLDMCSQITSISYFMVLDYTVIYDSVVIDVRNLRIWGGAACMLMWIRMFQWMRLFDETAHFISLLSKVLADLRMFNLMWFIVLLAFGNFFYTANANTVMGTEEHWVGNYTLYRFVDALIQMYMFSIGEIDIKSIRNADANLWIGWAMVVMATFVLNVIFMNLIISIIQDTYLVAKEKAEENTLYEQARLIKNMFWLVDIKKIFDGKKYIVHVQTQDTIQKEKVDFEQQLQKIQKDFLRKAQKTVDSMVQKINDFDRNCSTMINSIYSNQHCSREKISLCDSRIKDYECLIKELTQRNQQLHRKPANGRINTGALPSEGTALQVQQTLVRQATGPDPSRQAQEERIRVLRERKADLDRWLSEHRQERAPSMMGPECQQCQQHQESAQDETPSQDRDQRGVQCGIPLAKKTRNDSKINRYSAQAPQIALSEVTEELNYGRVDPNKTYEQSKFLISRGRSAGKTLINPKQIEIKFKEMPQHKTGAQPGFSDLSQSRKLEQQPGVPDFTSAGADAPQQLDQDRQSRHFPTAAKLERRNNDLKKLSKGIVVAQYLELQSEQPMTSSALNRSEAEVRQKQVLDVDKVSRQHGNRSAIAGLAAPSKDKIQAIQDQRPQRPLNLPDNFEPLSVYPRSPKSALSPKQISRSLIRKGKF